ncbi:MAG TPA: M23 family metallopeptidase [Lachnospiraceae bacterium]|nr:M23 family metallopeptidase [Lachnospiraceae bacterium]
MVRKTHFTSHSRFLLIRRIVHTVILLLLVTILVLLLDYIQITLRYQQVIRKLTTLEVDIESFRKLSLDKESYSNILKKASKEKEDYLSLLTINMILNNYQLDKKGLETYSKLKGSVLNEVKDSNIYKELYKRYEIILSDIEYFPVPLGSNKNNTVNFEDSWNSLRTYGGERKHEGTDIMASNNVRGYFPVVSVSDGVIEQKGWLEKGGYRIGVRSKSGAYFYYAHLHSYAPEIEVGDVVKAGDLLGFMGDTGYSKVEGTTGNFDVHLHFGIYYDESGEETSVNPYWVLRYLENYKLQFNY